MMRALLIALVVCLAAAPAAAVRIKDIAALRGARDSQLVGYGLVVGLSGTGDSLRNAPFTQQALQGDAASTWASTCAAPRCATATSPR